MDYAVTDSRRANYARGQLDLQSNNMAQLRHMTVSANISRKKGRIPESYARRAWALSTFSQQTRAEKAKKLSKTPAANDIASIESGLNQ